MTNRARVAFLACAVTAGACGGAGGGGATLLPSEQAAVLAWLRCGDCLQDELAHLLALATLRPAPTFAVLRGALLSGPGDTLRLRYWDWVGRAFDEDTAFQRQERLVPDPGPREEYVRGYWVAFELTYRARAAIALGRIRTAQAHAFLDSAATMDFVGAVGDTLTPSLRPAIVHALAGR